MFNKLLNLIKHAKNELSQEQKEAKIDLMLLMMYADRNITEQERNMLKEQSEGMGWENPEYYLELYIDKRIADVREVITDENKTDAFIDSIAKRLDNDELKQKMLKMIVDFIDVDADSADREKSLLEKVEAAFGM